MVQITNYEHFLSTTRINRFLRPLRAKCSALAALGARTVSSSTICTTTYSSTKSSIQSDVPPLSILSPPDSCTRLDATSCEWSQKIYAVRRAFKDIVEETDTLRIQFEGDTIARLPTLSALCTLVIGEHAEPDIEKDVTRLERERSVDVVETLYEEIPPLYRGATLVSHSLHIILAECPLSPTLLKLLLEITLENNLLYHSELLLRLLLSIALSPSLPTRPPPICHPAHSNFLVDLLGNWEQKNNPAFVFFKAFNQVMADVGTYDAWVCKAMTKLLQYDCRQNPLRLASVSANLVEFISKPELHFPSRQFTARTMARALSTGTLRRSLLGWLERVLRYLLWSFEEVDHCCFFDFLLTCKECWEHLTVPEISTVISPSPEQDAVSAIVSVTTFFLSQGLVTDHTIALQILSEKIRPSTTLFSFLILETLALSARLLDCIERIQTYAASLRKHGFLELEASLWASTLRVIEDDSEPLLKRYDKDALHEYRSVLIDCVEDAERRCDPSAKDVLDITNSPSIHRSERRENAAFGHSNTELTQRRKVSKRSHADQNRSPSTNHHKTKRPRLMPHRVSSFTSLLSNALSNHVVLHGERKQWNMDECLKLNDRIDVQNEEHHLEMAVGIEDLYGEQTESIIPSSDDCLDLLAYATSPAGPGFT